MASIGCITVVMVGLETAMGSIGVVFRHPLDLSGSSEINVERMRISEIRSFSSTLTSNRTHAVKL